MVMERLTGETLAEHLSRRGALTPFEVIELGQRVLDGLGAVHRASVIHRDLKPENVFLVEDPDPPYPKILDFGISQSLDPNRDEEEVPAEGTDGGIVVGTPEYMSPEQFIARDEVGPHSDLYSLGVILYEALTLECPYRSEDRGELVRSIVQGGAPSARETSSSVPIALSDAIARAMAVDPVDRFLDAREMRDALEVAMQWPNVPLDEALEQSEAGLEDGDGAGIADQVTDAEIYLHDPLTADVDDLAEGDVVRPPRRRVRSVAMVVTGFALVGGLAVALAKWPPVAAMLRNGPAGLPGSVGAAGSEAETLASRGPGALDDGPPSPEATEPPPVMSSEADIVAPELDASALDASALDASESDAAPDDGSAPDAVVADASTNAGATASEATEAERPIEAPPRSEPASDRVRITLTGLPRAAWVAIDGRRTRPPFTLPKDDRAHRVRVSAPGYRTRRYSVVASDDVELEVLLTRQDGDAPGPEPVEVDRRPAPPSSEPVAPSEPTPPPRTFRELDY